MEFELIRSNRKTIALEVTREERVLVRAPRHMSQEGIQRFVAERTDWIEKGLKKVRARRAAHPQPTEKDMGIMAAQARTYLPMRVDHYARLMNLTHAGITITAAATRFGSCSPKNRLCFSCLLMAYPAEAIDYVVVHELAHIVHKNHSKDFYALIQSVMPDYRDRIKLLKE